MSSLRDEAPKLAIVAVPVEVWANALREAVGDIAEGHELRLVWRFAEAVAVTWVAWLMFRFLAVIDEAGATADAAAPPPSRYTRLRQSLAEGGGAAEVYARLLTRRLAAVDRFFGDAGQSAPVWQRRLFFGLRVEAPLWTAAAYDRSLLLALVYPFGVLYFGWAISNHVGIAGHALGFKSVPEAWRRGLAVLSIPAFIWSGVWLTGLMRFLVVAVAFPVAIAVARHRRAVASGLADPRPPAAGDGRQPARTDGGAGAMEPAGALDPGRVMNTGGCPPAARQVGLSRSRGFAGLAICSSSIRGQIRSR